jgi:AraC family transcriptional regulator, regulatory protein of adaptative response / methylated-DNA-[protein]-cysteine methyltransferase
VRTTGVFCRPTCPARPPKRENCEFFADAQQALLASYRPCKRCRPLSHPNQTSDVVRLLVDAVEREPDRRWRDADLDALHVHASTARRQFRKRFGMTFVEYARARRLGAAFKAIRAGERVIMAQLDAGYDSGSGFRDAFAKIMGAPPASRAARALFAAWLDTPLGPMTAIADEEALYLLEYLDRRGLERQIERLRMRARAGIVPGRTAPIAQIEAELAAYFDGRSMRFATPLARLGSPFQNAVWDALLAIPPGQTRSYAEVARAIGRPAAVRAAARANGANQLAIVIPCHRVINADGALGGYGGGLPRKSWLLDHERRFASGAATG